MFSTSTQNEHWMFRDPELIEAQRVEARRHYLLENDIPEDHPDLLSIAEERTIQQTVEEGALRFCSEFRPPMFNSVIAVALTYFKRYYMRKCILADDAKNVMLGCMYLACKVEEFNVSITEFVQNMQTGSVDENTEAILRYELDVMCAVDYHLTVHTPYRPFEGFLIDFKTRCQSLPGPETAENLRSTAMAFLRSALLSECSLLFPPSQVALAALCYSAKSHRSEPLIREYIEKVLQPPEFDKLLNRLAAIERLVSAVRTPVDVNDARTAREALKRSILLVHNSDSIRKDRKRYHSSDSDSDLEAKSAKRN